MRTMQGVTLTLALALPLQGLAQDASDQQRERQLSGEVAPCRVRQGHRDAPGDTNTAAGAMTLIACARAIQAGGGTWGPYEVEVGTGGQIHVNDEPVSLLRRLESQDEEGQRG
ncbi:hypothetical protein [Siccirubricoccus phaeus]|uniref:hypothetical protein n=1 Tax=Siccirubricoccus phaeus TaxID=2595053 RepID=UPI0011F3DD33|nr:hypothetical protein [Siccirubricoccus phaeus]